jgi:hypothetical protein
MEEVGISAPAADATESVETTEQVINPEAGSDTQQTEETTQTDPIQKDAEQTAEVKTDDVATDGRTVPPKFKELFKDPQFKELKDVWFTAQALKKEGGLPKLREFRQKYEQLGGDEGVAAIEAERSEWAGLDEAFSAGDPKFVESIASSDPQAFCKMMPSALEQFQKADQEQYNHILGRVVFNTIAGWPIADIYNALKETKPELAEALADRYNGIKELAEKVPEKKIDPEREKLSQERTQFEQEKTRQYQGGVASDISKFIEGERNAKFDQFLKPYGKDVATLKSKDSDVWDEMVKSLDTELGKALKLDGTWSKTYNSILETRDHEKAVKHAKAKIESLLPDLMKKVSGRFFRFATPAKQAVNGQKPNVNGQPVKPLAAGVVKVTIRPNVTEIDHARNRAAGIDVLDKNSYLKGKKELVSWK